MEKISCVIITLNEEKNIGRCLSSLTGVVDEIVVVDSFSTDATEEICSRFQVRFVKQKFLGHIQQKNFAIDLAANNYILSLDADEALSETLKESILKVKDKFTSDAYEMNRHSNYCGKWINHSGWYPDKKTRLLNKGKGRFGGQNPHDKIILEDGASLCHLEGDILHYTYYTVAEHYRQADKFSTIAANELFSRNKKTNIFHTWLKAGAKFLRNYVIKFGFLDGAAGFTICRISAFETYQKYNKLRMLNKNAH